MKYNLGGKGIFVFSDPGGANAILALVDILLKDKLLPHKDFLVYTNKEGVFPKSYAEIVQKKDIDENTIEEIINTFHPEYVFSATSSNDYEHKWRKVAKNKKIKTYGFIDHWGNYHKRFSFNSQTIFADEIWVINEIARNEALLEGIPEESIAISGNPYYEKVKAFKPTVSKEDFCNSVGLYNKKKIILFVSDNIKESFEQNAVGKCILGYDEFTVLTDVLESFNKLGRIIDWGEFQFVIKIHPRSKISEYEDLIKENIPYKLKYILIRECNPLIINYFSDVVIGMFSNMIVESLLMNKKVLRIQTGQLGNDYLKFDLIKSTVVTSKDILDTHLINFLK